jgi:Polyketide cyclase / dehydrase and lipid transport
MKIGVSVEILRPAESVWPVLIDVERWPEWTASITKIERLDQAAFGPGSTVRIRQPKLKTVVWHVTEFRQGRLFTWETQSTGVSTIARHTIQPSEHGCIVTHTIEQEGWLAWLLRPFLMGLTQRYVRMEAQGLKKRCEALGVVAPS